MPRPARPSLSLVGLALCSLVSLVACLPAFPGGDVGDAGPDVTAAPREGGGAEAPATPRDSGADVEASTNDAPIAPLGSGEAGPPISVLLAASGGPTDVPNGVDPTMPFETHTVTVTRGSASSTILLAATPDADPTLLYVDDNIHLVVTPAGGATRDQYYEFFEGYPCPAASTTLPPFGNKNGNSPPIDVSFLFAPDTTVSQTVTLEFWHCAPHNPAPHDDFYLVEK